MEKLEKAILAAKTVPIAAVRDCILDSLEELRKYKDKEKAGVLVELPCTFDAPMYWVDDSEPDCPIKEYHNDIEAFAVFRDGSIEYMNSDFVGTQKFNSDEYSCLTKEFAEQMRAKLVKKKIFCDVLSQRLDKTMKGISYTDSLYFIHKDEGWYARVKDKDDAVKSETLFVSDSDAEAAGVDVSKFLYDKKRKQCDNFYIA